MLGPAVDELKDAIRLYLNRKKLLIGTYRLLEKLKLSKKDYLIKLIDTGIMPSPTALEYEVTDRCNLNCSVCVLKGKKPCADELSTAEVKRFIKRLPKSIGHVYITGGEPFLREDLVDILAYFDEAGIDSTILTNGTILSENTLSKLPRLKRIRGITVSLDSLSPLHDSIRGKKGTIHIVLVTIERLKKRKICVNIITALLKDNLDDIEKLSAYAKQNQLNYFIQPEIVYSSEDAFKTNHILAPGSEAAGLTTSYDRDNTLKSASLIRLKKAIKKIKSLCINTSTGTKAFFIKPEEYLNGTIRNCGLMLDCVDYNTLHIDARGDIFGCIAIRKLFGNALKDDISALWNSDEYKNFRLKLVKNNLLPICSQCCKMDILL